MTAVRVGVVGVGHLGYHHARIYHELPEADLIGVADPDSDRAGKAARDFAAKALPDAESLLEANIDAASIVAPTPAHAPLTKLLLSAGVDVLVEKPIASTVEEAQAMVEAAESQGRILQVGHVERFNGAVIALIEAVQKPRFIECHRLSPYPGRSQDVSVVHDLMIHDLEILQALEPSPVRSIDAVGVPVFSEAEDIANVRLRFASGCVANLTCSRVSMEKLRKIRIFESDAYVSTDYSEQEVLVYRKQPGPLPPGGSPMDMISVEPLAVKRGEPLRNELAAFLSCVRDRTRPVVTGEDGMAALQLAQSIVGAIREQQ